MERSLLASISEGSGNGSTLDSGSIFEHAKILIMSREEAKGLMEWSILINRSFF